MTALAPVLQGFFTDRLIIQRDASTQTIAAYRDTFRLLLRFAHDRTGKQPFQLDIDDLDAALIGAFLNDLEQARGNSPRTRNARLGAIHSFYRFAALELGVRRACELTGRSRASHYRAAQDPVHGPPAPRCEPVNKLSEVEVDALLALMNSEDFVDLAPAQIWAMLLDGGEYLASISTMYRVLRAQDQVRERRAQATHPPRARPELTATAPNQVWSWDITKLRGPDKGVWFDCYVIIDIFSRYIVGWMVAPTETAELAQAFIADAIAAQGIGAGQLSIHADRGTSMTSKPVAGLLADLGVARSHSRPHVSNDNPYSEAAFKTLKYCPAFPARFGSIEDARAFCEQFFNYYNHHHRHLGIALHTPASVHYGTAKAIQAARAKTIHAAYQANPRRFCGRRPRLPSLPTVAWINKPTITNDTQKKS